MLAFLWYYELCRIIYIMLSEFNLKNPLFSF